MCRRQGGSGAGAGVATLLGTRHRRRWGHSSYRRGAMGRFSGLVSVLVAVLIALIAVAPGSRVGLAQEATPEVAGAVLSPDGEVGGLDLAEWSARSWQWFFSLPQDVNPYFDETGESCGYGQSGSVFFLAGAE